jgi:hypothetical protein
MPIAQAEHLAVADGQRTVPAARFPVGHTEPDAQGNDILDSGRTWLHGLCRLRIERLQLPAHQAH